jgi:hypothetical protein
VPLLAGEKGPKQVKKIVCDSSCNPGWQVRNWSRLLDSSKLTKHGESSSEQSFSDDLKSGEREQSGQPSIKEYKTSQ